MNVQIDEVWYTVRAYAIYIGTTETAARARLDDMVARGVAEKIKPASKPHMYRILLPSLKANDPFNLIHRPDAPRIDDVNAWMFGANISGTCYDPRI